MPRKTAEKPPKKNPVGRPRKVKSGVLVSVLVPQDVATAIAAAAAKRGHSEPDEMRRRLARD